MNEALSFIMWLAYKHPKIYAEYYSKFLVYMDHKEKEKKEKNQMP